jgi:hypothetical protein
MYESFLLKEKLLDAKTKKEMEEKLIRLLEKDREFAENSPMPSAETVNGGVYCTGDDCHKIRAKWERPIAEVMPPKSCVEPVWTVEGFGRGKSSAGKNAPIHFGDVPQEQKPQESPAPTAKKPGKKPAAKSARKGGR